MNPTPTLPRIVDDELTLLHSLVPLRHLDIVELGCGNADLARRLVANCDGCHVTALEVDERQHAKNLERPAAGIVFARAGAQAIPYDADRFDLALMLKSLHHVPVDLMPQAFDELCRVLKPGGLLYVSEPVFAGELNEVIRLFHDEQVVRRAAYAAIERAVESGDWDQVAETTFDMPVAFRDFADFEQRIIHVTFADHRLDEATAALVRQRFDQHVGSAGAHFVRPMRVNLLRKKR